jgi:hypothetical protein
VSASSMLRLDADVASDHHLVVANIKLKLKKTSTHVNVKRNFDVGKLQDPKIQQEFKLEIKNRFQLLENLSIVFLSFSLMFATTRWWSLATSASRITHTSCNDLLHFTLVII